MIIISQDKKEITNFDNVMAINILDCEEDGFLLSAAFLIGIEDIYRELGYYKTEERAKEVLREITECYNQLKRKSAYAMGDRHFTFENKFFYEMPEN